MASQVEIASSTPFGCVLKDHNRRDQYRRESSNSRTNATQAAFQKNLKELVRDRLHTCISVSSGSSSDENSQNHVNSTNVNHQQHRRHLRCLTNQQDTNNNNNTTNNNNNNNVVDSSTMSCKESRILDRWAAKQAQEMVSTIENQSQEAEVLIISQKVSPFVNNSKPVSSNLGASSLVQIWEARLNRPEAKMDRAASFKNNSNSAPATSRTSSTSSYNEIVSTSAEESSKLNQPESKIDRSNSLKNNSNSAPATSSTSSTSNYNAEASRVNRPELKMDRSNSFKNNSNSAPATSRTSFTSSYNEIVSSSVEEPSRIDTAITNEDSLADWDSTGQSSSSSGNFRSSDAGESERVRISDIIKRLTTEGCDQDQGSSSVGDPPPRRHSVGCDQSEMRALSQIVNSPKIRGRQAFNDLLCQMEQERLRELESLAERQSVSRFPQRGRIQSMLRLRCLQRGVAIQDQQRSHSIRSEGNRSQQRSSIMHLRERFSSAGGVDHATSSSSSSLNDAATARDVKETPNNTVNNESSSTVNHVTEDNQQQHQDISITEQQAAPSVDDSSSDDSSSQISEIHEEDTQEATSTSSDVTWLGASSEGESFDGGEAFGSTQSLNNWDRNEEQQDFGETNYDWFSDIARPRSYWEDQRQAWYQEMLTTSSDNSDIRKLLERRTVSTFLSSDFRDRMDQLMESHVQRQVNLEDEELDEESQERMGQLILSFFQRHSHTTGGQQEGDQDEVEDGVEAEPEEEEEGGQVLQEEVDEDEHHQQEEEEIQTPASVHSLSPFRSWNSSPQHHEIADTVEHASPQSLPSQSSTQHKQYFASPSHPSIEMELIHDLRGHMEQMQHEMSELRKSMQVCMEMQAKMHNSLNQQQVHPVQEASKNSINMPTNKRTCCICYEMQVDSFLYRCGHMCTCLKCAHELQWSSRKCPICRAPILDVVRAYLDS